MGPHSLIVRFVSRALLVVSGLVLPAVAGAQPSVSVFAAADGCPDAEQHDRAFGEPSLQRLAFAQATPCDTPDPRPRTARAFAYENSTIGVVKAQAFGDGGLDPTTAIASAQAPGNLYFLPLPYAVPGALVVEISGTTSGDGRGGYIIDAFLPSGSFHEEVPPTQGATGRRFVYPYVVPPGGFVGTFRVAVDTIAGNGSADFGRSAYVWLEGAPLDPAEPDGALTGAQPPMTGDVNRDGRVNAADLNLVRRNVGTTAAVFGTGDMNGDGDVDADDVRTVRAALGRVRGPDTPAGVLGLSVAAPEPAVTGLVPVAAALLLRRRR
jgi:hypothetical protein